MATVTVTNQVPNYFEELRKLDKITYNTEFQRGSVWDLRRKQRLIDSMLNGYSIGMVVLRKNENGIFEVLDGQQRLRTIFEFVDGKKGRDEYGIRKCYVTSDDTSIFPNKTYSDLQKEHLLYAKFLSCVVPVAYIEYANDGITCKIFLRLQEGVPLNSPEKLNAMPGKMRNLILEFSRYPIFKKSGLDEKRFGYRYTCAQIALLELKKDFDDFTFPNIKFKDLEKIYKDYSLKTPPLWLVAKIRKTLNFLEKELGTTLQIVRNRLDFVSVYFLASYLNDKYAIAQKTGLENFISEFIKEVENIDPKQKISEVDEKRKSYAEYRHFRTTGALSSKSLKQRAEIIVGKFLECVPEIEPKDRKRSFDLGQKLAIYLRDNRICQKCGDKVEYVNADFHHKKWWSKGGHTTVENGQLMHRKCHLGCHCEDEEAK